MSTRSQIEFYDSKEKIPSGDFTAKIYHHWDGYPSQRLQDIDRGLTLAFTHYKGQGGYEYRADVTADYRYMGDLAAFYVVANKDGAGNVEIDNRWHSDIDYLYQVYPSKQGIRVNILAPKSWETFWENPGYDAMKQVATNTLKTLLDRKWD